MQEIKGGGIRNSAKAQALYFDEQNDKQNGPQVRFAHQRQLIQRNKTSYQQNGSKKKMQEPTQENDKPSFGNQDKSRPETISATNSSGKSKTKRPKQRGGGGDLKLYS